MLNVSEASLLMPRFFASLRMTCAKNFLPLTSWSGNEVFGYICWLRQAQPASVGCACRSPPRWLRLSKPALVDCACRSPPSLAAPVEARLVGCACRSPPSLAELAEARPRWLSLSKPTSSLMTSYFGRRHPHSAVPPSGGAAVQERTARLAPPATQATLWATVVANR